METRRSARAPRHRGRPAVAEPRPASTAWTHSRCWRPRSLGIYNFTRMTTSSRRPRRRLYTCAVLPPTAPVHRRLVAGLPVPAGGLRRPAGEGGGGAFSTRGDRHRHFALCIFASVLDAWPVPANRAGPATSARHRRAGVSAPSAGALRASSCDRANAAAWASGLIDNRWRAARTRPRSAARTQQRAYLHRAAEAGEAPSSPPAAARRAFMIDRRSVGGATARWPGVSASPDPRGQGLAGLRRCS